MSGYDRLVRADGLSRVAISLIAVAVCLVAAACSDDLSSVTPVTEDAESIGDGETEAFSVLASLRQIQLSAAGDVDEGLLVSVADLDAAADQARLRRPTDSSDVAQLIEFFGPLTGAPVGGRRLRVFVDLPSVIRPRSLSEVGSFVDELGFSPGDVTTFAHVESLSLSARAAQFVVVGGVSVNPDLPEVVSGVQTAGEGEDFEVDAEATTPARPVGIPLRLAERDGLVALSWATAPLVDWLDGPIGATLADEPALASVAIRLDEEAVVSAILSTDGPPYQDPPYDAVGLGWAAEDGEPRGVIVLAYPTEAEAQQQLANATAGFEGHSFQHDPPKPIADFVTLESIEVRGSEIIATVSFLEDTRPSTIYAMLRGLEGPFAVRG